MFDRDLKETALFFYQALITHLPQIVYALVILVLGWWLAKLIGRLLSVMMKRRAVDLTVALFISRFIYIAIITFTILAALAQVGVQTNSVVALLGASFLAIGLALRNALSNLASGILLIAFRPPFKVGHVIEVAGQIGMVKEVQFLYTIIQNFENKMIAVPNSTLMSATVIDYWAEVYRVTDVSVVITYDADLLAAKAILLEVAQKQPGILKEPKPFVAVNGLKEAGVSIFARVAINNAIYDETGWAFLEAIKLAFDANNIKIAHRSLVKISD
ncbi:MAG: mechanosensitive ion channel [Gammaproteobacteria bacterium]|jgi:small conductance mechanosensitive channel|nr:mechanosensitive ion channel [Gammaproteobacteria bacterium]